MTSKVFEIKPNYDISDRITTNSSDVRAHRGAGTLDGWDAYCYVCSYVRGFYPEDAPAEFALSEPLDLTLDGSETLSFETFTISGDSEIKAADIALYAVCGGEEYRLPVTVSDTVRDGFCYNAGKLPVSLVTVSAKLTALQNRTLTNLRIVPCTDISRACGAFRLVSLYISREDAAAMPPASELSKSHQHNL